MTDDQVQNDALTLSVVVPVKDEADNIAALVEEIDESTRTERAEIIFVDDGSGDESHRVLQETRRAHPRLRILTHDRSAGQSRAILSGVRAAQGQLIVVLDGDGQNDPADIPALLTRYREDQAQANPDSASLGMVGGLRAKRHDSNLRRLSSRVANGVNRTLLRHEARDTGCGLKLVPRSVFLRLPYFDHMHRFMPALMAREGLRVIYQEVNHRPRAAGRSKYGLFDRLAVGLVDLFGVRWLQARAKNPNVKEEDAEA